MTNLVTLGQPPGGDGGAGPAKPHRWSRWLLLGGVAVGALYLIQASPKLYPLALLGGQQGRYAALERLSRDDPATPGENGSNLERGEPLSDHAVFLDWLAEDKPPGAFTIGGAIDAERPRTVRRLAQEAAAQRRDRAAIAAERAQAEAGYQADLERQRRVAEDALRARTAREADQARGAAASARTVACNTARAHAYATAASSTAFIAWVRAHPCPEGTDIGDGYWNVAR